MELKEKRIQLISQEKQQDELEGERVLGDLLLPIAELCDLRGHCSHWAIIPLSVIWKNGCPPSPVPALAFGDSNIK